jgi:hypothetical protein
VIDLVRKDVPFIRRSVDIDLGLAQIGGNAVGSHKQSASRVIPNLFGHLIEIGLVAEAPAILGVVDSRSFGPRFAQISRLPDGDVRVQRAVARARSGVVLGGKVVLPRGEQGIVAITTELPDASVQSTGDGVVVWRVKDGHIGE